MDKKTKTSTPKPTKFESLWNEKWVDIDPD
jgi:hypothetical protein